MRGNRANALADAVHIAGGQDIRHNLRAEIHQNQEAQLLVCQSKLFFEHDEEQRR